MTTLAQVIGRFGPAYLRRLGRNIRRDNAGATRNPLKPAGHAIAASCRAAAYWPKAIAAGKPSEHICSGTIRWHAPGSSNKRIRSQLRAIYP